MNRKMIAYMIGSILQIESVLLLLPLALSLVYRDGCYPYFLISIAFSFLIGLPLTRFFKSRDKTIFAREGFIIVALSWLTMSLVGALPFYLSGQIPSFIDAFFETVSGFTTTGASVVTNIEEMSHSLIFWRSFTHWIGGMGVLVFIMAIFPSESGRSVHIMRAEMPGPIVGKLVPRVRNTAKLLYFIYIGMTVVQIILLLFGDMNLFESIVHTFGSAGTGGFGLKADSIGGYSAYSQWVITIFMFLFGINFNLYYLVLIGKLKSALKSTELWVYFTIVILSVAVISVNIFHLYGNLSDTVRHSAFQVSSIITTTGYSTADFNIWPEFSKTLLIILMFVGACAGSTGGGIKVSRVVLLFKSLRLELRKLIHPRSVGVVNFEGKRIDDGTLQSVNSYLAVYFILFFAIFLLLSLDKFNFTTNFTATASCFNNIGPGLDAVGPMGGYSDFSGASKLLLSGAMLLGRLEIFPILLTISPSTWTRR